MQPSEIDAARPIENKTRSRSPKWNNTTKLVISLGLIAILAGLIVKFNALIGPLLLTFIVVYLIYPIADFIRKKTPLPWRVVVGILYLVIAGVLIGLFTWGGIWVVSQLQSLIYFLQNTVSDLPTFINDLSQRTITFGPLSFNLQNLYLSSFSNQIINAAQSLMSRVGNLLGSLATGTASTIGWLFFILWVSYFVVSETEGRPESLVNVRIPGFTDDFKNMQQRLTRIWDAFLRGQLLIIGITIVVYMVLLGSLGLRYYFALAFLAGLARFVPYIGPAVAWSAYGLVALSQGQTIFGLSTFGYIILIVAAAWVTDFILDNFVVPRLMADTLKIHPALVMVAAIGGAILLGLVGVVLAAPVSATIKLFVDYTFRKLFDQDPWEGMQTIPPPVPLSVRLSNMKEKTNRILHFLRKGRKNEESN